MGFIEIFLFGILGGILPEIHALYKLRHTKNGEKPEWLKSRFYWSVTLVMILLGGVTPLVYVLIGINVNALVAVHLGAVTPVILANMQKKEPEIS